MKCQTLGVRGEIIIHDAVKEIDLPSVPMTTTLRSVSVSLACPAPLIVCPRLDLCSKLAASRQTERHAGHAGP